MGHGRRRVGPRSSSVTKERTCLHVCVHGFNGHIDEFRIAHVQRSDGWIATTWNNVSNSGAFAVAGAEEQEGGEPLPLAGAGLVVCLMG